MRDLEKNITGRRNNRPKQIKKKTVVLICHIEIAGKYLIGVFPYAYKLTLLGALMPNTPILSLKVCPRACY